jgi:hypothetical protein
VECFDPPKAWKNARTGRGRPESKWEDDVKNYLKNMRINNWSDCVRNRRRWKEFIEKAKTSNF